MKRVLLMFAACFTLLTLGCKKNSDSDSGLSKTELITNKNWVLTAATVDPALTLSPGVSVTNLYNQFPACNKDNILIFKTDKSVLFDEGATRCNTSDPQTESGTWTFNPTETILSITQGGNTVSITIKSLSSKKMTGSYQEVFDGTTYTIDQTFEVK